MQLIIVLVVFAAGLALAFAAFNFFGVRKLPEGNEKMQEIARDELGLVSPNERVFSVTN